jgi:hypothetical protein
VERLDTQVKNLSKIGCSGPPKFENTSGPSLGLGVGSAAGLPDGPSPVGPPLPNSNGPPKFGGTRSRER